MEVKSPVNALAEGRAPARKPTLIKSELLDWSVPGERIELPTFGLQNRCSTAELTRRPIASARVRRQVLDPLPAHFHCRARRLRKHPYSRSQLRLRKRGRGGRSICAGLSARRR